MTRLKRRPHDERGKHGRYIGSAPCDACGKPVGTAFYTDDDVCGGSDGPGFYLCDRKQCIARRDLPLDARRALYIATRGEQ